MNRKTLLKYLVITILAFFFKNTLPYDNSHFYRARFFPGEPRFEKPYLSSLDVSFAKGSTCEAIDGCGNETCLLNIYGCDCMQFLGKNIPCKDLNKDTDLILHQLAQLPANENFARLSFKGEFDTWEAVFSYYQNFAKGIFLHIHLPVRKLEIHSISYCSPSEKENPDCDCENINDCMTFANENSSWNAFLNSFGEILRSYNLCMKKFSSKGIGDTSIAFGWTKNYEDTEYVDYIDATVRVGVTIPTGKCKDENEIFSLPLGYNGHVGIFGAIDFSLGLYDWLTFGAHLDILGFTKKRKCLRVKTAFEQCGFIKLAKEMAEVRKGPIYNAGVFGKADHVAGGFSLLIGYSYTRKEHDCLEFCRETCIDCAIAGTDEMLQEWAMHTIHFFGEYDFTEEGWKVGPRISAFYNLVAGGKRIFKTGMGGAGVGFEITWK